MNDPIATFFATPSRSADSSTITAALPPSSSVTFFFPQMLFRCQPTLSLPVKESIATPSSRTSFSATALEQVITLQTPAGNPDSLINSAKAKADRGACGAGLMIIGQPTANAG